MRTAHVWATKKVVGKNTIRQLLVPAHDGLDYTDDGRPYWDRASRTWGDWPLSFLRKARRGMRLPG